MAVPGFLQKMITYDKDTISDNKLKTMEKYTQRTDMTPEMVTQKSVCAAKIWGWVLAMELYAKSFRDVRPKKIKVKILQEKLEKSARELQDLKKKF